MSNEAFIQGLNELYQGEVLGEVLFNRMLELFPEHRYEVSIMFQLETETKARLRPTLMQLGADIIEREESRKTGLDIATSLQGKDWKDAMAALRDLVKPAVQRYKEIADDAPAEYRSVAESMAVHEKSLYDFLELEIVDDGQSALPAIVAQLHNTLPTP
jgi:hypothetical protein